VDEAQAGLPDRVLSPSPTSSSSACSPSAAAAPASVAWSWPPTRPTPACSAASTNCGAGVLRRRPGRTARPARAAAQLAETRPGRRAPGAGRLVQAGAGGGIPSSELTLSPNHTAAWGQIRHDAGLAMRFPPFTWRWRDDKATEDATTNRERAELFLTARRTPTGAWSTVRPGDLTGGKTPQEIRSSGLLYAMHVNFCRGRSDWVCFVRVGALRRSEMVALSLAEARVPQI
jgi:hypothetical protein